jgi:hypothetical protein
MALTTRPPLFTCKAMMIHGGAWSIGGSGHLPPDQVTYLLEEGFAVVSPEYRLAPHVKLAECVEDLLDAYRFVQTGLNQVLGTELDVKRTCVMGWSAGGTGTLLLVSFFHLLLSTTVYKFRGVTLYLPHIYIFVVRPTLSSETDSSAPELSCQLTPRRTINEDGANPCRLSLTH